MQFKAYWRWESKDLKQRAEQTKAETEKNISELQSLLKAEQTTNTLDPNYLLTVSWTDPNTLGSIKNALNDPSFVRLVDPALDTTLAKLIRANPTKAKEIIEETLYAHQSKLKSIQYEQDAGLGNITLSDDEIETLETYASEKLGKEREHARLVQRVLEVNKDPNATQEQKAEASETLRQFRIANPPFRSTEDGTKQVTARGVRIDDRDDNDPIGNFRRAMFGGSDDRTEDNFSRMGKGSKKVPPKVTTATLAGENRSIFDQMISIYLPFCNKINNEDTMTYEAGEMKAVGAALDFLGTPIETTKQGVAAGKQLLAELIGQGDAATKFLGVRINPRLEKLFKSKDFRTFNFSWELYPKNRKEVEQIHSIIEAFRYHGHPAIDQDKLDGEIATVVLRVPAEFQIRFLSTNPDPGISGFVENPYIPKIARCVLNNISVDYTPNGIYSSLKNNAPTSLVLTLQFTEIGIITREAIEIGF
jgi:hypothetical protein